MPNAGESVCTIPLTQGKVALVDKEDYERISQHKWHASRHEYKGKVLWYAQRGPYNPKTKKQTTVKMHGEILGGIFIDHINGNGLDNRRCNLRFANYQQNSANREKNRRKRTSKFKGVWYDKSKTSPNKWRASIQVSGKRIHLGRYKTEIEAAQAYDLAAIKHFGTFAKINEYSSEELDNEKL